MDQAIWGPSAWKFIHSVALNYPLEPTIIDKQHYRLFFEYLMHVLPCPKCKHNYEKEFNLLPIDSALENREALVYWTIDIHNSVNKRLGKREYTYEEVYEIYRKLIEDQNEIRQQESKGIKNNNVGNNVGNIAGNKGNNDNRNTKFSPLSGLINSITGAYHNNGESASVKNDKKNETNEDKIGIGQFLSENCLLLTGGATAVLAMYFYSTLQK
jgi:uncharacterized protein YbaR (Trm112 family)